MTDAPPSSSRGSPSLFAEDVVLLYHERTKHHPGRYAASLGYLDWHSQPDPFRRFTGAEVRPLVLPGDTDSPPYSQLYLPGAIAPAPLTSVSVARLLRYAFSLSVWKQAGGATWSLRVNPSSGNLHPTEAYVVLPPVEEISTTAGVFHYAVREHALERRASLRNDAFAELLATWPSGAFLVGLSSIHWREAWKYGERAFRYCQHDIGHAFAALRMSAAALGWRVMLLDTVPCRVIASLLGVDRYQDFPNAEREEAELLALIAPNATCILPSHWDGSGTVDIAESWFGQANVLSAHHVVDWTLIETVAEATRGAPVSHIPDDFEDFPTDGELRPSFVPQPSPNAAAVTLGRRSATAMDGTPISNKTFLHLLSRLIPTEDSLTPPWDALPWRPRIHLGVFVHRVEGLSAGLFALPRDPERGLELKAAMSRGFLWEKVSECPDKLPLYLLERGDFRQMASALSCGQVIAGDGAFSVAMIAEFRPSLALLGSRFYRRLFWEAGMIGQILYLEAQACGLGATGLGCYFDDQVHALFGLSSNEWQSLYHFTVGRSVPDKRITTLPAYAHSREPTAR